jgi:hypothetical protein
MVGRCAGRMMIEPALVWQRPEVAQLIVAPPVGTGQPMRAHQCNVDVDRHELVVPERRQPGRRVRQTIGHWGMPNAGASATRRRTS